jgi:hypothetical protein
MKTVVYVLLLLGWWIGATSAWAQQHDPNPRKDPDVQQGYNEHQEQHRQKDTTETYTVHKTGEGHGGIPTSGNYDPPKTKDDSHEKH